jgi:hypothetical protein
MHTKHKNERNILELLGIKGGKKWRGRSLNSGGSRVSSANEGDAGVEDSRASSLTNQLAVPLQLLRLLPLALDFAIMIKCTRQSTQQLNAGATLSLRSLCLVRCSSSDMRSYAKNPLPGVFKNALRKRENVQCVMKARSLIPPLLWLLECDDKFFLAFSQENNRDVWL